MAEPASASAPVDPKRIREIKIKSGVVKRLVVVVMRMAS